MKLADFQTHCLSLVRDEEAKLSGDDITSAINSALYRLNQDAPCEKVVDVTAADENIVAVPANFESKFSQIINVEYPIGERPRASLAEVFIYQEPNGEVLDLPSAITGDLRITFTVRHSIDDVTSTFSTEQQEPLASYVASILCGQLATLYSHDTDSVIQSDSVNHASKSSDFRRRARDLNKVYIDYIGVDKHKDTAAGVVVSVASRKNYLTHGRNR